MRPLHVVSGLLLVAAPVLPAQKWVGPKSPCTIEPGHFRINSGVLDLKLATEKPEQRDRMLHQAQDVLVRAIRDDKQDKNPAAWYYLGRYFFEVGDATGADTAFRRAEVLAPQCKADIGGYRAQLAEGAMNRGLSAWQGGNRDSAVMLLRQSYALDPSRPKALFQLGSLYEDRSQFDSAAAVLRQAAASAGDDPAYADARRDALLAVARLTFRRTQSDPAVQKWQRSRYTRDSIGPYLAADSTVLARMQQSSASRRARGARLSPADQKSFGQDSAARAESVARGRAARDALRQQASSDSAAAQPVYGPAISAYRDLVVAYPANTDAVSTLAAIYAQAGRWGDANSAFEGLFARSGELSASELYTLGQRLMQSQLTGPGIKAYRLALQLNPFHRNALAEAGNAYLAGKDADNALGMGLRLVALDPLNKAALHLLAQAWDLRGRRDSAQRYLSQAESLAVDLSIASMVADSDRVTLTGIATNLRNAPSKPFRITVEFLDTKGAVLGSQPVDLPVLQPAGNQQFEARAAGKGIVGWRYRPS